MASSAGEKGGVLDSLRSNSSSATTSISPVGMLGFSRPVAAAANLPFDRDDKLRAGGLGFGVGLAGLLLVEDDLGDAGAVAHVEEDEVAVVAAAVDPAHQDDVLVCVFCAEVSAHVGALEGA